MTHCISSDYPLFDEKRITDELMDDITGEPTGEEIEYDEWNGVIEHDSFVRAHDLYHTIIAQQQESLDTEPEFNPDQAAMRDKVVTVQKNTKQRFPEDAEKVFHLDRTQIADREKADEILIEEFEQEAGRKRLDGEDVKVIEDKIKLIQAQKATKRIV